MTASAAAAAAVVKRRRHANASAALSGASLLTLATLASGLFTYVFLIIAARTLGRDAYGQVGTLWAAMFLISIVVFRPLEQTASREIARRREAGIEVRSVIHTTAAVAAGASVILVVGFGAAWGPLASRLFGSSDLLMAALVVGVLSYGASYVVRGVTGGLRWFNGYALVLIADGGIRLALALPLLLVGSRTLAAAAVAGAGLGGAVAPLAVARRRLGAALRPGVTEPFPARRALTFASPAVLIAGADQILVNGAPLLVAISGGSRADIGLVFAATMLVRAPVFVFQGFAASLLPNLTHLARVRGLAALRAAVARTAASLLIGGLAFTVAVAAGGPAAMRTIYGPNFDAPAFSLALLAAGVAFYLTAGTFSQALLALDRGAIGAACWACAVISFAGCAIALPGGPLIRVSASLALASLVGAVTLGASIMRASR